MRTAILATTLLLAACGGASGDASRETPSPAPNAAAPTPAATPEIALEELGRADIDGAKVEGELACSFRRDLDDTPIWFGRGNVNDEAVAESVVKLGGALRTLRMKGKGGYDAMADGARFEDGGIAVAIARTSEQPLAEEPQVAEESPIYPATLTFAVTGEEERTVQGLLECGP